MTDHFTSGEVYFRVTYAEPLQLYPLIESFVFVGKNLSDEDSEDTWYFQFAQSLAKYGSILDGSGGDRKVRCLKADELEEMFNHDQLRNELNTAADRRKLRSK